MRTTNLTSILRTIGFSLVFILVSIAAIAQTAIVRGTVKDANGLPLAGASVILEGTRRGTTSDASGNYELRVNPGNYTLIISYVGIVTQRKQITVVSGAVSENSFDMQNSGDLNRIIVVGSRSTAVRSSTQTAVPRDVITSRDLILTGQVEPTQMINFIAPSFNSSRQTVADGTDHIDPATIRGLGPDQVLVLLNGRRRYNTALLNVNGTVGRGSVGTDLNSIPSSAIEKIEVLRDGAASQYGSDAIAGVINVVTKKNSKGFTVNSHWGKQYAGDGEVQQLGMNWGTRIGKEGGYFNISGDLRHRDPTNRCGDYTARVYTNDVVADMQLIAQNNFSLKNNMHIGNSEVYNKGVLANMGFSLGKTVQFFLTAGWNRRNGKAAGFYRYPRQTTQVITALYPNGFLPEIHSKINDSYIIAGIEGKLVSGWNWDLSQASGGNTFRFNVDNSNNASQYALGTAAQTEFYAGKLAFSQHTSNFNISRDFGKEMGLKSFNLAFGTEYRKDNYKIASGEEASYKNYDPNSGKVGGAQVFPGFQPSNAVSETRNVIGGYVDVETDINDKFLVNGAGRYEHYSDYGSSIAGKLAMRYQLHEKFAIRGAVSNGFRAPSMHQRFFSTVSTVFIGAGPGGSLIPVQQGTFRNNSDVAAAFGVPSLKPEKSTNFSIGITSRPSKNFSITVDGYLIDIKDRIVLSGSFLRYNSNGTPDPVIDPILDAYPNLNDVGSAIFFSNAIDTRTKGIDVVIAWAAQMGKGSLAATLAGNVNKSTLESVPKVAANLPDDATRRNTLFDREQQGRLEQGQPRDKESLTLNYRIEKWMLNVRNTRFGKVATRNASNPALDEFFDPKVVTDASLSYKFANFANLTVGANNIGDVYPDKLKNFANTSDGRFVYSRNATQFGFNGGYYFVSLVLELQNIRIDKKQNAVRAAPTIPIGVQ